MEKNKRFIKSDYFVNYIIILIYFVVGLLFVLNHEAWRDEAQAWVIAKNLSLNEIINVLHIEGHPILWFLLIVPFAKLGFSFYYFNLISLLIMTISVVILLFRSPFNLFEKIIIILSSSFLYYNSTITRVYCLVILLVVAVCSQYEKRYDRPFVYCLLLGLLLQTQIKVCGFAIALVIEYIVNCFKNKRLLKYSIIPLASLVFLVLELLQNKNEESFISISITSLLTDFPAQIMSGFYKVFSVLFGVENYYLVNFLIIVITIITLVIIKLIIEKGMIKDYLSPLLCGFIGIGSYYLFTAFIYKGHRQMSTILMIIIVGIVWIMSYIEETKINKLSKSLLIIICLLSIPITAIEAYDDIKNVYSYGKETSGFIEENLSKNGIVLLTYDHRNPVVYSYVNSNREDILFYDLENNEPYRFYKWSVKNREVTADDMIEIAMNLFGDREVYLLSTSDIDDDRFVLLYSNISKRSIAEENFNVYLLTK